MSDYTLKFSDKVDLNVALDSGENDAGITYEIPSSMQAFASVDAAGIVTPLLPGTVLVYAKDAEGFPVSKFIVEIESDRAAEKKEEIKSGARQVRAAIAKVVGGNDITPPIIGTVAATWAADSLDINLGQLLDTESGVAEAVFDLLDEFDVVVPGHSGVAVAASSVFSRSLPQDGKTYKVRIRVTNGKGLQNTKTVTFQAGTAGAATNPVIELLADAPVEQSDKQVYKLRITNGFALQNGDEIRVVDADAPTAETAYLKIVNVTLADATNSNFTMDCPIPAGVFVPKVEIHVLRGQSSFPSNQVRVPSTGTAPALAPAAPAILGTGQKAATLVSTGGSNINDYLEVVSIDDGALVRDYAFSLTDEYMGGTNVTINMNGWSWGTGPTGDSWEAGKIVNLRLCDANFTDTGFMVQVRLKGGAAPNYASGTFSVVAAAPALEAPVLLPLVQINNGNGTFDVKADWTSATNPGGGYELKLFVQGGAQVGYTQFLAGTVRSYTFGESLAAGTYTVELRSYNTGATEYSSVQALAIALAAPEYVIAALVAPAPGASDSNVIAEGWQGPMAPYLAFGAPYTPGSAIGYYLLTLAGGSRIGYKFGSAKDLTGYSITSHDEENVPNYTPRNWQVFGSMDNGVTWDATPIETVVDAPVWTRGETRTYTLPSMVSTYNAFSIVFTEGNLTPLTAIVRVQFLGRVAAGG